MTDSDSQTMSAGARSVLSFGVDILFDFEAQHALKQKVKSDCPG